MKIVILTSGGDAPGMNKFIAQMARTFKGQVYGCKAGFRGLINNDIKPIEEYNPFAVENEAGSCIYCSRCPEFATEKSFLKAVKNASAYDLVVVLGGNGSFKGAKQLAANGVRTIFVPATIDNDVDVSEYSLGFHTAVKACCDCYYNIMPSMQAFNRCCVFMVMGRRHNAIALNTASAVQADYVVTDKVEYDKIAKVVKANHNKGRATGIILRENLVPLDEFMKNIESRVKGLEIRGVTVGHAQRGTAPTRSELAFAKKFAKCAIKVIKSGNDSVACVYKEGKVITIKNVLYVINPCDLVCE